MKTWKVIRIWKVSAGDKQQALRVFHELESQGKIGEHLTAEFAVEDKDSGIWGIVKSQIFG